MNILAIDTTKKDLVVVLKKSYKNYIYTNDQSIKHLKNLMPAIDSLLSQTELSMRNIDVIAVVVGPGSFTGIRIGVATAKGLAFGGNIKTLPVNALDFVAYTNFKRNGLVPVSCIISSTLDKFYVCDYEGYSCTSQVRVSSMEEILNTNDISKRKLISSENIEGVEHVDCSPEDFINYVEYLTTQDVFGGLEPYYVALSQAERELLQKEKANGNS